MNKNFSSLIKHTTHALTVDGFSITVDDGVFTPDPGLTFSPRMIITRLPDLREKSVLDLGCGSGVLSVASARRGARSVLAADVSPFAVQNTWKNIRANNLDAVTSVRQSDLFSNIPEKFDLILANLPILEDGLWQQNPVEIIERFLSHFSSHLNDGGAAWLTWGSFSSVEPLVSFLHEQGLKYVVHQEDALGYTWSLFEIQKHVGTARRQ